MVLLENEQFLTELTRFYLKAKTNGTVQVCMKRYDGRTKPIPRNSNLPNPPEPHEYKCLLRATMGNKKLSTIIAAKDVNKFQLAYSNVIKGNIELKKKEKEKKSASKNLLQRPPNS